MHIERNDRRLSMATNAFRFGPVGGSTPSVGTPFPAAPHPVVASGPGQGWAGDDGPRPYRPGSGASFGGVGECCGIASHGG